MSETRRRSRWHDRVWTTLKILNVRLRFILLMVVTGLIASQWDGIVARWERWTHPLPTATQVTAAIEYYCPMHPSVVRAEPGNCPICGMPLSQRGRGEGAMLPEGVLGRVQLTPYRMQLAGVATSAVGYRDLPREIRAVGTIEPDEGRIARITTRVGGRVEKLYVDFAGERVSPGQPLAEIYSPDLITAQQEYLTARRQAGAENLSAGARANARAMTDAARERLRLWGVSDEQVSALEQADEPPLSLTLRSPIGGVITRKEVLPGQYVAEGSELYTVTDLSVVWMTAHVYEDALSAVRVGQRVAVTATAAPGREIAGEVSFVSPTVDPESRTVRVRVDVENTDLALRPGTYVDARILVEAGAAHTTEKYICPMCPDVVSDKPGRCPTCGMFLEEVEAPAGGTGTLVVPESAVIDTGERRIVYLEREPGVFDAVEVKLGTPANGFYPVLSGLAPGDRVVTQGAFLVDAEIRLNPAAAGSYFGASGHGH